MEPQKCSRISLIFSLKVLFLLLQIKVSFGQQKHTQGSWQTLLNSTGVVAMHMALTHHNTVIILDQIGPDNDGYRLRRRFNGTRCVGSASLRDSSCYAHSVEYDVSTNTIRPLRVETNTFCSSGSFLSSGTLLQTGGNGKGSRRIRYFRPCNSTRLCDWREMKTLLADNRWYASNQLLPENDMVIVVGGRRAYTYEFVPKLSADERSHNLPFLHNRNDKDVEGNNYYPFLHLSSDGNLFIFANRDSILFDYKRNRVVKTYPTIPGEGERTYPHTGSSVILPLDHSNNFTKVEVMICGGAGMGAERAARQNGVLIRGMSSCGRMVITGHQNRWEMENMPGPRLLHDMIVLPTGHVIIINGARRGSAGWNNAGDPALEPYLYNPKKELGRRFTTLKPTKIARMYHSSAILLPNGKILVAGSNPNNGYTFRNVRFPTELRLQAYTPYYMERQVNDTRPRNVSVQYNDNDDGVAINGANYGNEFTVLFRTRQILDDYSRLEFVAYGQTFTTHSISMNQRMLKLRWKRILTTEDGTMKAVLAAPPSARVAPAGYYMISVVNDGIPSLATWVRFLHA